jgi:uncharacterized protein YndB with AHSA1/START domain
MAPSAIISHDGGGNVRVEAATVINATPEQVFRFITIPENGPRWQEGAVWTRVTTPGPVRLGSEMEHEGRWLRLRIPTTGVVTVYEPPRRYGYDITTKMFPKPLPMRYAVEPVEEGTKLTLSNEAPLSGWMKPLEHLLQRNVQGMFQRDVVRLKALIEAELAS